MSAPTALHPGTTHSPAGERDLRAWMFTTLAVGMVALRRPGGAALVLVVASGFVALAAGSDRRRRRGLFVWCVVTVAATAAFVGVAILGPAVYELARTAGQRGANVAAAVAEEIVFRGALYDRVAGMGPVVAVTVTAVVFGIVHAPVYGWGVVPLDIGAGLVLGWQRAASGGWSSGAVSHTVANLMG